MKVLPNPDSRLGWKFFWVSTAVGVSLLLGAVGANPTVSILVGMACAYLLIWYLKNKVAESEHPAATQPLTSLSLDAPTQNQGIKAGSSERNTTR